MPYLESPEHVRAFDHFRHKLPVDVDWVKFQVYGKQCVPEEFPKDVAGLNTIIDGETRVFEQEYNVR